MTDISTNQPATVKNKLIKTGLLSSPHHQQSAGFASKLKQPLGSTNANNNILNNQNNNYYHEKQNCQQAPKCNLHFDRNQLSDDVLKNDVQIVLNNIQNAILSQQKTRQQQQEKFYQHQDRFKFLNIFGGSPSNSDIAVNQRNNSTNNNLYLRKMSMSPAECDNTNNNNNMLGCSFASDFTHDNSDYQWFIDYG